ncbi:unnamed protein product [Agarophyton chilense]
MASSRRAHRATAFVQPLPVLLAAPHGFSTRAGAASLCRSPLTPRMGATDDDLLIVGAGHLGSRIARQWRRLHPAATIVAETKTNASHPMLRDIGCTPALASASSSQFPYVAFCVPPRGDPEYDNLVDAAAKRARRRFVFTSSTSVYATATLLTEDTPTSHQGRAATIYRAEKRALAYRTSFVVRLAGLYLVDRGPHTFWLSKQVVPGNENSPINLVHYDDAAAAIVCALRLPYVPQKRTFLIGAPEPVSRRRIIECALKHPQFEHANPPQFLNDAPLVEKLIDGSWSNQQLDWRPLYSGFEQFMQLDAERLRASSAVKA